jgi:alkaline phosphatase D
LVNSPNHGNFSLGAIVTDRTASAAKRLNRRQFLQTAVALGATAAWAGSPTRSSLTVGSERRDLYQEGVASGDPDSSSVMLWTRRQFPSGARETLHVEISETIQFDRIVAAAETTVSPASDWTCRVLVGHLKPSHVYWYRFIDAAGNSSRVGRTLTAPRENDPRTVRFAFVSCQNTNVGEQHAYRRMIFDDERAADSERLGFVLHLGDFIYEVVWYPEDRPQGMYERRFRDIVRYPHGEKISDFHIPTTVEDYRAIYRAYLHDPDLQDARARWPFVCIWDNHEFSWNGWQSIQIFNGKNRPTQTRKVAANQAWFEYQPARIRKSGGPGLEQFSPPEVHDGPIEQFDADGMGDEPNNRAAIASLTGYRAFRWGRHVELIITDQRSYRSEEPTGRPEAKDLSSDDFPELVPQEAMEILDAGRLYGGGNPPANIRIGEKEIRNFRKDDPPQSLLGSEQKGWFLQRLRDSQSTWKVWGNTLSTLEYRADPQNLPAGLTVPWPGAGYACFRGGDASTAFSERAEIYAAVRDTNITGFATLCGDRHSFWAGLAAASLPPKPFEPIGVAFVVGSISAPGPAEKFERGVPQTHPLRALYMVERSTDSKLEPTVNMLIRHGVRSCLEFARTGDLARARSLSNPNLSPHLSFLDLAGHGFALVRASGTTLECEFVCIPRPSERITAADGGPVRYRVVHSTSLWNKGQTPKLQQRVIEGDPGLSL